jgi:hypothetical protein
MEQLEEAFSKVLKDIYGNAESRAFNQKQV